MLIQFKNKLKLSLNNKKINKLLTIIINYKIHKIFKISIIKLKKK